MLSVDSVTKWRVVRCRQPKSPKQPSATCVKRIARPYPRSSSFAALTVPWDCQLRFGHPLPQSDTGLITVLSMRSRPQPVVTNLTCGQCHRYVVLPICPGRTKESGVACLGFEPTVRLVCVLQITAFPAPGQVFRAEHTDTLSKSCFERLSAR
jgi:hypothetical protein